MRADPNLQFTVLEPNEVSLRNFIQMLKQVFVNFMLVLNGHIGFGDGTNRDNIDGNWINVTTPVAPNTDFTVNHNLQRIPVGYIPMEKDRAVDIYTGSVAATTTQLTLRATVASAVVRLFILCAVLAVSAFGQSTSVTVNVTDSSGQVWISGNYKISFWTNPSFPNGYQWQGSPFNQTTIFTGTMDGSGNFTVSIPDNSTISPAGSAWKFTVCPLSTFPCYDQIIGVSGTTQNINIVPPPILISPTPLNSSYLTSQSKAGLGSLMYKIIDQHVYVCAATAPYRVNASGSCSNWIPLCEPGDGLCGGASGMSVCSTGNSYAANAPWTTESVGSLTPGGFNNGGTWGAGLTGWVPINFSGSTLCSSLFLTLPGITNDSPFMVTAGTFNRHVALWGPNYGFQVQTCLDLSNEGYTGIFPPDGSCTSASGNYTASYNTTWSTLDRLHNVSCVDQLGNGTSVPPIVFCTDSSGRTSSLSTNGIGSTPRTFATLPGCVEGITMPVTDSTTSTWGATITGGGTNHVLAYCDGTNWTVAAK